MPYPTPFLDKYGHDWTRMAAEDELAALEFRVAEGTALTRLLERNSYQCVILSTGSDRTARSIVVEVAWRIAQGRVLPTLENRRIILLEPGSGDDSEEAETTFRTLLAEAAKERAVLFLPGLPETLTNRQALAALSEAMAGDGAQENRLACVLRVDPDMAERTRAALSRSEGIVAVMAVCEQTARGIPNEL